VDYIVMGLEWRGFNEFCSKRYRKSTISKQRSGDYDSSLPAGNNLFKKSYHRKNVRPVQATIKQPGSLESIPEQESL
jgi:hypothetical protein